MVRRISRRSLVRGVSGFSLALATSPLLAACGADDDDSESPTSQPEEPAATATPETDAVDDSNLRTFEHALGTSEIPADPQSVAVLNIIALDSVLLTGLTPVVATVVRDSPWRTDDDEIGTLLDWETDVELLAQANPDLILDGSYDGSLFSGADPAVLENVAPLVAFDFTNDLEWPEYFRFFADAINRAEQADEVLAEYEARVEELASQLGDDAPRVALLRVRPDSVRNQTQVGFVARIFDDLGIPTWGTEDTEFSLERIGEIDADVVYIFGSEDDAATVDAAIEQVTESPLWQSHPAFIAGQVHVVGGYWFGFGPTEAMLVLDDLEETLLGQATSAEGQFPITIEHAHGSIEIPAMPERVVVLGFSEQDAVLALGVKPVAVREWFGEQPFAVWPWSQDALGDHEPEVLVLTFGELDFEQVAALQPDLIVATHSGITADEYETLSQIAPTLAQSGEFPDFGMPWQEQTVSIGQALGREAEANSLVDSVEQAISDAADDHPEFDGATIVWVTPAGDGQYWLVGPTTPPMRFLSDLGFVFPQELEEIVGDQDSASISQEQVGLIDQDVVIVAASSEEEREMIENDPIFQRLTAHEEGRVIFFAGNDDPLYGALSFSTVASLPYAVENLVPVLAAAVDGDPETDVSS